MSRWIATAFDENPGSGSGATEDAVIVEAADEDAAATVALEVLQEWWEEKGNTERVEHVFIAPWDGRAAYRPRTAVGRAELQCCGGDESEAWIGCDGHYATCPERPPGTGQSRPDEQESEAMADSKYGRLYTEADMRLLASRLLGDRAMGPDLFAEAMDDLDGRFAFPADEPLFLLRGQDKAAPHAIAGGDSYYEECIQAGYADGDDKRERLVPHLEAVQAASDSMVAWQAANRDRVKVPD